MTCAEVTSHFLRFPGIDCLLHAPLQVAMQPPLSGLLSLPSSPPAKSLKEGLGLMSLPCASCWSPAFSYNRLWLVPQDPSCPLCSASLLPPIGHSIPNHELCSNVKSWTQLFPIGTLLWDDFCPAGCNHFSVVRTQFAPIAVTGL